MKRREVLAILGTGAAVWPLAARAQQKAMPVVGVLSGGSGSGRPTGSGFEKGLKEAGYVGGQNITVEYLAAGGRLELFPAMAAELVSRKSTVIVAIGSAAARAAKAATSTIPIVFVSGDPVAEGLAASLARPGGNLTGVSIVDAELTPKRLELLSELVPQAKAFALLVNPIAENAEEVIRQAQSAAAVKGVQLHILTARSYEEIDAAFDLYDEVHASALIIDADPLFTGRNDYLIGLASNHAAPAIYGFSISAWAGGLISYGPSIEATTHLLGVYTGKILNGAKPAELPIEQPTRFELIVNLKTAKALGITVPPAILARADAVIE